MSFEQVIKADLPLVDDDAMLVRVQREDFSIDEELRPGAPALQEDRWYCHVSGHGPRPLEGQGCGWHHL